MFTDTMCKRLLELVEHHNDSSSCSENAAASPNTTWKEIVSIFNAEFPTSRKTVTQLQVKLKNLRRHQEASKKKLKRKVDGTPVSQRKRISDTHQSPSDQTPSAGSSAIGFRPSTSKHECEVAQPIRENACELMDAESAFTPRHLSGLSRDTTPPQKVPRLDVNRHTTYTSTRAAHMNETLIDLKATVLQRQLEVQSRTLELIAKADVALDLFMRKMAS